MEHFLANFEENSSNQHSVKIWDFSCHSDFTWNLLIHWNSFHVKSWWQKSSIIYTLWHVQKLKHIVEIREFFCWSDFFREINSIAKNDSLKKLISHKNWVIEKFPNFHTVLKEKSSNQRLYTYSFYRINLLF